MTTPKRRTAARAAGVLATILCLLGMGFGRADAELLTPNRCTNHYVNAPVHNYTMTVCWQYGYRAQGDGTGVYDETLYMDIRNACDHLDDPEVYNMTLTLRNPKTGVVNGVQDLRDAHACNFQKDIELQGRDVGDETASLSLTFNLGGLTVD